MKISDIHIRKQDLPESGQFPPHSPDFDKLKKLLKKKGIITPVFVDADGVLLQGHYRLWAWQSLDHKHIPAVVVRNVNEIASFFA